MHITKVTKENLPRCFEIYQQGLKSGIASFQNLNISLNEFCAKIDLDKCLVLEIDNDLKGYAFFTKTSNRCVYNGIGEVSIYLSQDVMKRGYGQHLLNALNDLSEELGFWSLHAMIFPHNISSIKLHEKCDFKIVGIREKVAKMTYGPLANQWIDIVYMERRSLKFQD